MLAFAIVSLAIATQSQALAQTGSGAWGMPSLHRVMVAEEVEAGVDAAAIAGGAHTGAVLGTGDSHARAQGSLAVAGRVAPWLTIAARTDGRYDVHLSPNGSDPAGIGEPRVALRTDVRLAPWIAIGALASVLFPGSAAPSLEPDATTVEARAFAAFTPDGLPLTLAIDLGARFDRTARVLHRPSGYRPSDLLTLAASDADALLFGAGGVWRVDDTELFAETTVDVFVQVGTSRPTVRVAGGLRTVLVRDWLSFFGVIEGSPPTHDASALLTSDLALVPTSPFVTLLAGLVLSPRTPRAESAPEPREVTPIAPEPEPPPEAIPPPAPPRVARGTLLDPDGTPLSGAHARTADGSSDVVTGPDGSFVLELPADATQIELSADGYVTANRAIAEGETSIGSVSLERDLPRGVLRGLVRSHRGDALSATLHVDDDAATSTTDADGVFEIPLAPGRHRVAIESEGYARQERSIEIEEGGVTVLNVELRGAR